MLDRATCPHVMHHLVKSPISSDAKPVVICKDCLMAFDLGLLLCHWEKNSGTRMADMIRILGGFPGAPKLPMAEWLPLGFRPDRCEVQDDPAPRHEGEDKDQSWRPPGRA